MASIHSTALRRADIPGPDEIEMRGRAVFKIYLGGASEVT
jgi:hypothetical protein